MKLSGILKASALHFGNDPCAAVGTCILTYESAWQVLLEHEAWLKQYVTCQNTASRQNIVVAYVSGNSIDFLLSILACMNLSNDNITVALLNTRWTPSEMAASLQTNDPFAKTILLYGSGYEDVAQKASALFSHESCAFAIPTLSEKKIARSLPSLSDATIHYCIPDKEIDSIIQEVSDKQEGNEDAVIVFTSGTTSGSKGVRLSHKALYIQALAKLRQPCQYSRTTRMLASTVPLFHVGGLSSTLSVLLAGGTWILPSTLTTGSGFDPSSALQSLSSPILPVNTLVVVPAMLHSILEQIPNDGCSYESVRLLLIGGQSASPETLRLVQRVFFNACIVQTFACTEAASSLTFLKVNADPTVSLPPAIDDRTSGDCVGVPPPHVELTLIDKDKNKQIDSAEVKQPYQVGILATRGPHVMNGYWKRDDDVSNHSTTTQSRDSWYLTNDLGFRDEVGQYYFCGRTKDIIRTGGETVIALEVERVLLKHADIRECAVFALPDNRFGEAVCAAVVCSRNEPPLSLSDVRSFCTQQGLSGYKKPRRVYFVKELPRNSSGKVLKHKLVDRFRSELPIEPLRSKL